MLKAARNRLAKRKLFTKDSVPTYLTERPLFNAPDRLFAPRLAPTYTGILNWLKKAMLKGMPCQSGQVNLLGLGPAQSPVKKARKSVRPLQKRWDAGDWRLPNCRPRLLSPVRLR